MATECTMPQLMPNNIKLLLSVQCVCSMQQFMHEIVDNDYGDAKFEY